MTSDHDNDSGLQVAMRMLLSIIAGLLLADILKLTVSSLLDEGKTVRLWADFLAVSVAALLFIARVVVDNVLYYNAPDAKLTEESYSARVLLIVCDLVSYTLCYHIVNLLTAEASKSDLSATLLIRVIFDMALVELLHAAWCHLALERLKIPATSPHRTKRRNWWRRWRATSAMFGTGAFIWATVALTLLLFTDRYIPVTAHVIFLLSFAIVAAGAYAYVMRDEYSGDWQTPDTASTS
ncbi:MAG TPA: hypothetical protein VFV49_05760 [Thermoanaerobaculia bacterium]|nr:hypothetical protein [Thermoanaerobaculia bacterium]